MNRRKQIYERGKGKGEAKRNLPGRGEIDKRDAESRRKVVLCGKFCGS